MGTVLDIVVNPQIAFISYMAAAAAFTVLTALLLTKWRDRTRGSLLLIASIVSIGWAIYLAVASIDATDSATRIFIAEIGFDCIWLFFLSFLLGRSVTKESNWLVRYGGVALGLSLLAIGLVVESVQLQNTLPAAPGQLLVLGSIATSLYALVGIEQLYRNVRPAQQNGLKFLCLGLGGIFAYDLILYSNAVVDGFIQPLFWNARGFVIALCVPFIAIAVNRIPSWSRGLFASRQVVFYTTTLFAAGIYLSLIGFAGYYIKTLGREWGDALQLVFFSAAVLAFLTVVMSEQLRAKIRVTLTKHFFERKYDYRAEWLRLIHTLTSTDDGLPLKKRAVQSLAQVVGSPSGHLWMRREGDDGFDAVTSWNSQPIVSRVAGDDVLPKFLAANNWIIDVKELREQAKRYKPLKVDDLNELVAAAAFIVPLLHEDELLGFMTLATPKTPTTLNFEDHDLLKTAGQQIASYLAQETATEQLAEHRQFEAYNRFTAFIMHDLKNAIAQQSLVVENAEKHKRNPEFVDDAMETIKGSVTRMRRVMSNLRQSAVDQPTEKINMSQLLQQAESQCSDRDPVPVTTVPDTTVTVRGNRERLLSAFSHAIRNAQDATDDDGRISISLEASNGECCVRITDTGVGMEAEFVRDRLFRPFDSTKGAEGMGIGAYQIRESLRACGGDVDVESAVGSGTTLVMRIPALGETGS